MLSIGEVLVIPGVFADKTHVVVPGDTLWSIARMYNTTVGEIQRLNNLNGNLLNLGMVLKIPN